MALAGETPIETDLRHLFYEARNKFLRENPQFIEPDSKASGLALYQNWQNIIKRWCEKHTHQLDIDPTYWWRLREILNVWAKPKATCEGTDRPFLVGRDTREEVTAERSLILVCEKETVSRELLERLQQEGYRLNIVSTGGTATTDVLEVIISESIQSGQNTPTFYILTLHDFDMSGIEIGLELKKHFAGVIDVGINSEFIEYLKSQGDFDPRLVQEQVLIKKRHPELKKQIEQSDDYSIEDFEWLEGEPFESVSKGGKPTTHYRGKRIEIDAIHVQYGIEPFIIYILKKIEEECAVWNLRRIGVEDFDLENPDSEYEMAKDRFELDYNRMIKKTKDRLTIPFNQVNELIKIKMKNLRHDELEAFQKVADDSVKETSERLKELEENYSDTWNYDWTDDFEDRLKEVNDQIDCYEGDVRKGADDLEAQRDGLQNSLQEIASDDESLGKFKDELKDISLPTKELDELEATDLATAIRAAIAALQGRLEEIAGVNP